VSRNYKVRPTILKAVRRGIENEPGDVAMYLIGTIRSEPLMRVGAGFSFEPIQFCKQCGYARKDKVAKG
jgi:hypothetical protein